MGWAVYATALATFADKAAKDAASLKLVRSAVPPGSTFAVGTEKPVSKLPDTSFYSTIVDEVAAAFENIEELAHVTAPQTKLLGTLTYYGSSHTVVCNQSGHLKDHVQKLQKLARRLETGVTTYEGQHRDLTSKSHHELVKSNLQNLHLAEASNAIWANGLKEAEKALEQVFSPPSREYEAPTQKDLDRICTCWGTLKAQATIVADYYLKEGARFNKLIEKREGKSKTFHSLRVPLVALPAEHTVTERLLDQLMPPADLVKAPFEEQSVISNKIRNEFVSVLLGISQDLNQTSYKEVLGIQQLFDGGRIRLGIQESIIDYFAERTTRYLSAVVSKELDLEKTVGFLLVKATDVQSTVGTASKDAEDLVKEVVDACDNMKTRADAQDKAIEDSFPEIRRLTKELADQKSTQNFTLVLGILTEVFGSALSEFTHETSEAGSTSLTFPIDYVKETAEEKAKEIEQKLELMLEINRLLKEASTALRGAVSDLTSLQTALRASKTAWGSLTVNIQAASDEKAAWLGHVDEGQFAAKLPLINLAWQKVGAAATAAKELLSATSPGLNQ